MESKAYSIYDQAADLGIHRLHSLVLGDPKKEARIAAKSASPTIRRAPLGKGDARHEERQQEENARRELNEIARRHNART